MAKYGGEFVGVDISENQIKYAESCLATQGLTSDISFVPPKGLNFRAKF